MYPKVLFRDNDPQYSVVVANEDQERALPPEYNSPLNKEAEKEVSVAKRGRKPSTETVEEE